MSLPPVALDTPREIPFSPRLPAVLLAARTASGHMSQPSSPVVLSERAGTASWSARNQLSSVTSEDGVYITLGGSSQPSIRAENTGPTSRMRLRARTHTYTHTHAHTHTHTHTHTQLRAAIYPEKTLPSKTMQSLIPTLAFLSSKHPRLHPSA
jgi:hypothetical protein